MTYARRYIDVTFSGSLSQGDASVSVPTLTFNARGKYALRTSARILKAGGANLGSLQLELRGLSLAHILQLSTYGTRFHPNYNYDITVNAGDDVNGMTTVFTGKIQQAWADMKAMPDCPFHVVATGGGGAATLKVAPTSFQGPTPVVNIMQKCAQEAGLTLENNGVNAMLADPYFWGSPWKKIKEAADAAGIGCFIDNNILAIWPQGGSRPGNLYISPQTGLRDYPSFTEYGVQVRTEFKKAIDYNSQMTIQSVITPACGTWNIIRIDYDLQANTPHGSWYAILNGSRVGSPVTSP